MIRYKFSKFSTAIILALLAFAASVNAQQALDGGAPGDASVTSDASPAPTPQIAYRYDCTAAKAHRNNPIDSMSPITETAFANAAGSVRIPGPGITLLSPWDADAHSVTISRDNVRGGRNLSLAVNYRTPHGSLIVAEAEAPLGAPEVSVRYYLPRETFDQPVTVVSAKCTLVRTITASPRVTQPVAPLPPPVATPQAVASPQSPAVDAVAPEGPRSTSGTRPVPSATTGSGNSVVGAGSGRFR